jgi:hypothetical protein
MINKSSWFNQALPSIFDEVRFKHVAVIIIIYTHQHTIG